MLFSFPLMAAMREICARLGRVTGIGIAGNRFVSTIRNRSSLALSRLALSIANIFNLGADVSAMGAAAQLVVGGNLNAYVLLFGVLSLALQTFSYPTKSMCIT